MNSLLVSNGQECLSASKAVINRQKYLLHCLLVGEWLRLIELLLKKRCMFHMKFYFLKNKKAMKKCMTNLPLEQLCNRQRFFMAISTL